MSDALSLYVVECACRSLLTAGTSVHCFLFEAVVRSAGGSAVRAHYGMYKGAI